MTTSAERHSVLDRHCRALRREWRHRMRGVADQRDAVRRRPRLLRVDRMDRPGRPRAGFLGQAGKCGRGAAHGLGEDAGIGMARPGLGDALAFGEGGEVEGGTAADRIGDQVETGMQEGGDCSSLRPLRQRPFRRHCRPAPWRARPVRPKTGFYRKSPCGPGTAPEPATRRRRRRPAAILRRRLILPSACGRRRDAVRSGGDVADAGAGDELDPRPFALPAPVSAACRSARWATR